MGMSVMQEISLLSSEDRATVLGDINPATMMHHWPFWARPEQMAPADDTWSVFAYIAGRGAGKTRSGCEWARDKAKKMPGSRGLLVARTAADVRDVLVSGESGLLNICPPSERPIWEPSKRRITWPNGSYAIAFSADEPDQLRGPQGHWALADEYASWKDLPDDTGLTAWDNLQIACRLGEQPQIFVMTTPKRTFGMRTLMERAETSKGIILRRGSTKDNIGNLSPAYLEMIYGLYEGTRLAQQELEGLMLDDIEGALWTQQLIDANRVSIVPLNRLSIVVGVDPSVAENPRDECGIVVLGATKERHMHRRHAYVLEDASIHGSPDTWALRVAETARKWGAPVIAEINQGGDLVRAAIAANDPTIKVFGVHSRQNKQLRAEPVVMATEQSRVHHVGVYALLEAQMASWVPGETKKSPDRVDAMVFAATALLIKPPKGLSFGGVRAKSAGQRRLPASSSARSLVNPRLRPGGRGGRRVA
jgi:phage terminase large subunit-like protein